jgi:hypothetical protein
VGFSFLILIPVEREAGEFQYVYAGFLGLEQWPYQRYEEDATNPP